MYKVTWDIETGGVQLNHKIVADTLSVSPRPVFFEELDLLRLNELGWTYPHCEEPLLWACNKQYFYRGQLVFEAKGANLYEDASIIIRPGFENLSLIPVNMDLMLRRNQDIMFLLESEAIEFIRDTFIDYSVASKKFSEFKSNQIDYEALAKAIEKRTKRKMAIVKEDCDSFDIMDDDAAQEQGKKRLLTTKIDVFLASFSGGKDSQVVLDLCTRALPPSVFEVIYSDTGYELPASLSLYEEVKKHYVAKFPGLRFSTSRNHASVLSYWDRIGTPSDTHRWCCSVMKTAPLYRSFKILGSNKQARVLTFDGVRAEESTRRSNYKRLGKGVKHSTVINAHPILNWNTTEIFLYLFANSLPINLAYRFGKARVGCIICPYSSCWDDMIVNKIYQPQLRPFIERIQEWSEREGIKDVQNYIRDRKWKFRASGKFLSVPTQIIFKNSPVNFFVTVKGGKSNILEWIKVLAPITLTKEVNRAFGDIKVNNSIYSYEINGSYSDFTLEVKGLKDLTIISSLKRIIYKASYCINCESCEIECPTGALSVYPSVQVNSKTCIHCHRCLNFHDKGCIVANSINMTTETSIKAKAGIDRYNTFGIHEEWMAEFLMSPEDFWENNCLGPKQVPSFKNWLKEAEIVDSKLNLTELGSCLSKLYIDNPDFVWSVIFTNLTYNSFIVKWFVEHIAVGQLFDKTSISDMISEEYPGYGKRTVDNAVSALFQLFKYCPSNSPFNLAITEGKMFKRISYEASPVEAVSYSLYKYGESVGYLQFRVADLYDDETKHGPVTEFGIAKSELEKVLRTLNSANNRVLIAELNMGLDHITLRDDIKAISVVKQML